MLDRGVEQVRAVADQSLVPHEQASELEREDVLVLPVLSRLDPRDLERRPSMVLAFPARIDEILLLPLVEALTRQLVCLDRLDTGRL